MNTALTALLGKPITTAGGNHGRKDSNQIPEKDSFQSLFSQISQADHSKAPAALMDKEDRNKLKSLLENMKAMIESLKNAESISEDKLEELNQMTDEIMSRVSSAPFSINIAAIEKKLEDIFDQSAEEEALINRGESQELETKLQGVLGEIEGILENGKSFESIRMYSGISVSSLNNEETAIKARRPENIELEIHTIWQQFQGMVQKLSKNNQWQQMDVKTGQDMKDLLQKLNSISQTLSTQEKGEWKALVAKVIQDGTGQEKQLFQKLMTALQNRAEMPKTYNQQTHVTGKEMVKWVKQSFGGEWDREAKIMTSKQSDLPQATTLPSVKVEQHIIQMNQSQDSPSLQKQLHQKLEQLIQSSRMFTNAKGNTEMQIKLRPGNLGELTVKFAQVNGEMAVKILATSQAAKDMLEGNMKQLRHMFSPQQVVIEKVEVSSMQQQLQQGFSSEEDTGHGQGGRKQEHHQEREETDEEELSFHELLMNEKV
ncbi:flagellar hook-length control protein FliK [Halobacillus dabanensis]|uniref:flagellar hook-length control protein FliK n=1 Tax=Halobacillus dabanensis TaxID=240302 RepID=UPI001428CDF1|nr:flagellar hook-length control protein FliK [Halobacillus dabanensis]